MGSAAHHVDNPSPLFAYGSEQPDSSARLLPKSVCNPQHTVSRWWRQTATMSLGCEEGKKDRIRGNKLRITVLLYKSFNHRYQGGLEVKDMHQLSPLLL